MTMDRAARDHAIDVLADILRPLSGFLRSDTTQEVMVNGPDDVWVEQSGQMQRVDIRLDEVSIRSAIEIMARLAGKEASEGRAGSAIVDARLTGLRVAAALSSVATRGPSICIRKHSPLVFSLERYRETGAIGDRACRHLIGAVEARMNILVSGGTSSGKTTFLNALIGLIPPGQRVITIEDTRELRVGAPNHVGFEANEQAGVTIRDLVKLALRYRPDRLIVGEVRGPEAFDLMQAMNTGHDGGFATLHANSARAALRRLETLVLAAPGIDWPLEAIRVQIADTFDYVVHLERVAGRRLVKEVVKVDAYNQGEGTYEFTVV